MDEKLIKAIKDAPFGDIGNPETVLSTGADICEVFVEYLQKEQPYATVTIDAVRHAADALRSSAAYD